MVLSFPCLSPMHYASAKKSVKKTNLRKPITPKLKTSTLILKIKKILIQNQVLGGKFYIETYRGKRGEASRLYNDCYCFLIREIHPYHGRRMQFAPTITAYYHPWNPIIPKIRDSKTRDLSSFSVFYSYFWFWPTQCKLKSWNGTHFFNKRLFYIQHY